MTTGNLGQNAAHGEREATAAPSAGIHVGPGEGRLLRALASQIEIKAGEDAGLSFGIFRSSFPPGTGMPFLHVHKSCDEAFYVLRGEVQFQLGAQEIQARAGSAVLIPPAFPIAFATPAATTWSGSSSRRPRVSSR